MYKKKGLGLLWEEKKETSRRLVLLTARRIPDVMFFLHARRVPTCSDWNYTSSSRGLDTSKKLAAEQD